MEYYALSKEHLLASLQTSEQGLTGEEGVSRLQKNGRNELKTGKKRSLAALFFGQFCDLMTIILIAAAFLSAVLAFLTKDKSQLADTAILLFIILLNAVVGFLQQYRADSAIEKLKKLSVCTAKVVRDGRVILIPAEELAVGDVIEIEEGDRIPADCRILSCEGFRVDESSLTGESKAVKKRDCTVRRTSLAERENTAFLSSFCVAGHARAVVVKTGMDTEMGKIADLLAEQEKVQTPLDKTVAKLGKIISITVLSVAGVLFLGGLIAKRVSFLENVMAAVSLAVAAIPEGMGAVVTIILAMGVQRMASARAVMRKLSAVETLGNCTCICSDKTGTLTKNRMTVEEIATDFSLPTEQYGDTPLQRELLRCVRACHTVKGERGSYIGDPTEIALVEYADRVGFACEFSTLGGEPFSSERKRMSVAVCMENRSVLYVKGGLEVILRRCDKLATASGVRALNERDCEMIAKRADGCSARAMRVLAFARGEYQGDVKEEGLTFLGIVAMLDPPKDGAREAVAACKTAGIKTVMITGDSAQTAFAIANRLGIASHPSQVITGEELDEKGEEYMRRADEFTVYARVSPKHKSEIVRALQNKGEVVAMTGDGVNDAPSIRAADIGVAMGSGTDVSKNAADMVIADDDFSTIVSAVGEGRNVFYNVKKTISFFLSTNLAEVLAVLIVSLFLWQFEFLSSTQLLWINLITDSLPVLALGVERTEGAMNCPPVSEREIFSKKSLAFMLTFGIVQTAIVVGVFAYGALSWGNGAASTAAFFTLSFLELFHAFNVRKEDEPLKIKGFTSNKTLLITAVIGVAVNVLLAVVPPLSAAFDLTVLSGGQWAIVFVLSASIVPIGELYKLVFRKWRALKRRRRRTLAYGNAR